MRESANSGVWMSRKHLAPKNQTDALPVGAPRGLDRTAKIGQKALLPPLFVVSHPPASHPCRLPLRVGIAGPGIVGAAVIKLLGRQAEAPSRRTGRQIAFA